MAIDPRIPREHQRFEFKIRGVSESDSVEWIVNREIVASQNGPSFLWPLAEGKHVVSARVSQGEGLIEETAPVEFVVW